MSSEQEDQRFLDAALRLARKHQGLTGTNPSVACVIVKDLGHGPVIIGSAVTARGGRPHAEPPALAEAGDQAKGATAYVTLEPCAHHGKTPPCAQTLVDAGVSRVVTAITDPDKRVNGQGHKMLTDAGVEVTTFDGGQAARRVIQGYLKARSCSGPFVTLKLAMTADGMIGEKGNGNLRISGDGGIRQTHLARARHHAILVGSGTLLADNPELTCRLPGMKDRSPVRVILDRQFRLSDDCRMISTAMQTPCWVVAPSDAPENWASLVARHGVQHIPCEIHNGKIALPELLDDLAARGIQSLMVEGGAKLAESFLQEDLVDEIIVHVGHKPQSTDEPGNAVFAPFKPNKPPHGFSVVQQLEFEHDTSLRMRRTES